MNLVSTNSGHALPTHYHAFVSYSHADEKWAAWLQRRLERFRIPEQLRQRVTGAPARLRPIFRDREELASSDNLGDAILAALQASNALIVVCSPAARRSRWVNEEIRQFRKHTKDGKILCLLVDGSPDPESPQCAFPEALLHDDDGNTLPEPLAADVRKPADGKTLARQKIVAGLLDVPLDAIRQRENQHRQRFMAGMVAASLTGMGIMGLLAWSAMVAKQDAERRQNQAEQLVEYLLQDLHDGLREVGRLDIMQSAALEAKEYFADLDVRDLTEESLQGHAESLRQLGDLQLNQRQIEAAYAAFEQAWRMDKELLDRSPDNPRLVYNLAQDEFWLGYAQLEAGNAEPAIRHMTAYLESSRDLYEREPGNVEWVMELCYAHNNLAGIYVENGETNRAIEHMRQSVQLNLQAIELEPDDTDLLAELAYSEGWMSTTLLRSGFLEESLSTRQSSTQRWQALHESDPDNADHRYELAIGLKKQANAQLALGQLEAALELFSDSMKHWNLLLDLDSENALWRMELATMLADWAPVNPEPELKAALAESLKNLADFDDPGFSESPRDNARVARIIAVHGRLSEQPLEHIPRALELLAAAAAADPQDMLILQLHAEVLTLTYSLSVPGVAEATQMVLKRADEMAVPENPYLLAGVVSLDWVSRRNGLSPDWAEALQATGFRHPSLAEACAASESCADLE